MPLYDYLCPECGLVEDIIAKMDDKLLKHDKCGKTMIRQLHGRFGINMGVGAYGYYDENLGTYISTNKQRREEMQKQGVTERIGKGWY